MPIGPLDGTMQIASVDPSNPSGAPQPQAATTTDGISGAKVPESGVGLAGLSGITVDRWREATDFPTGSGLVSDPTLQAQIEIVAGLLRTLCLLTLRTNQLLRGSRATASPNPDAM